MKKMSLKYKILLIVICVVIFLVVGVVFFFLEKDRLFSSLGSSNVELDYDNYKGIVEYSSDVNFMLVINNSNKVSNIIFLDKLSISTLADKKIEGMSIDKAVYKIIELLNEDKLFSKNIILTSYQDNDSIDLVYNEVNKNLVIFGSAAKVNKNSEDLSSRVNELKLNGGSRKENLKALYDYSKLLLLDKSLDMMEVNTDDNGLEDAKDIYMQLVDYANGNMDGYKIKVDNQEKDDPNGLLITDLKSEKGKVVDSRSWYSIKNFLVVASISIENNEYCFNGSVDNFSEGSCNE